MVFITLVICVVIVIVFSTRQKNKYDKLPPGPKGLPIIGNFHQIGTKPHKTFKKWAKQFGNIYHFTIGKQIALVVSDQQVLRDLFNHPSSIGKLQTEVAAGLTAMEGEEWAEHRQVLLRSLRKFGFGTSRLESLIQREAEELIENFKNQMKQLGFVSITNVMDVCLNNTLWTIIGGERYDINDHTINKLVYDIERGLNKAVRSGWVFIPYLKYLFPNASGYRDITQAKYNMDKFLTTFLNDHRKTLVPGSPRDLTDCYLEKIDSTTDTSSMFFGSTGEKHLLDLLTELFEAGSVTTSLTMKWAVLYLSCFESVQIKLQEEIDRVAGIGSVRPPTSSDKSRMPYTEAVITEILRITALLPIGVPHRLLADLNFQNYVLPKDALLIANTYGIHLNKDIWGDPEVFRPERFLDNDGKFVSNSSCVPFTPGKRECLGKPLVKDVMFHFITAIFHSFKIQLHPDEKPDFEPITGIGMAAKPYTIVAKSRV